MAHMWAYEKLYSHNSFYRLMCGKINPTHQQMGHIFPFFRLTKIIMPRTKNKLLQEDIRQIPRESIHAKVTAVLSSEAEC